LVLVVVVTLITDSATRSHLHLQSVRLASSNQAARQFVWDVSQSTAAADVERVLGPTTNALDTALDTVHLFADKTSLEEALLRKKLSLDSLAPPWSDAKTTFKAFFRSAREPFLECDASIRGYSSWHHQDVKPSFRLRFSKKRDSPGFRWLELSRPEDALVVINWFPDQVGQRIGLLTNRLKRVRLFLNKQDRGVYLQSLRPGDRLALENVAFPAPSLRGMV